MCLVFWILTVLVVPVCEDYFTLILRFVALKTVLVNTALLDMATRLFGRIDFCSIEESRGTQS